MFFNNLKGGLKSPSTSVSVSRVVMISFIMVSLAMILSFSVGNVSAAPINTTHDNLNQVSANQAEIQLNTTTNITNTQATVKTIKPDPQIYNNGAPVARGGNPAGYEFPSIAAAIIAAQSGDTIMLENGATFYENSLTINKNLDFNVFNNGQATINSNYKGTVFIIDRGVTVILQNLMIENGKAVDGGAVLNNGTLTVKNCSFNGNTATDGDGIYSVANGGAIYNAGALTVIGSTFTGNTATAGYGEGGAIYNEHNCTVTGSNFMGNTATTDGGAIYSADDTLTVNNSTFTSNTAGNGGAIYNGHSCTITGSTFKDNSATEGDGGAIYNSDDTLTVNNSTFIGNTAKIGDGGAIHNEYGTLNINGSNFTNNTAPNDDGYGGAIYNYGGTLTVTGSKFIGNIAGTDNSGGAIYNGYNLTVNNSTFTGNTATNDGGAIYTGDYNLSVNNSTFTGNTATNDGGAIYSNGGSNTVNFNRIIGNSNYDIYNSGSFNSLDALYNWWGTNFKGTNPVTAGRIYGGNASSWMVLSIGASPTTVLSNGNSGTSTVTADLLHDNQGVYHNPALGVVPYTGSANFATNKGTVSNINFSNGASKSTFNALTASGVATVNATVDQATVNTNITIDIPPTVVSVNPANNTVNVPINKVINITFSKPITIGSAYNQITVKNSAGALKMMNSSISGSVLTLTPVYNYLTGYKYTITIPANAVKDNAGNNLASTYSSTFTIVTVPLAIFSTDPVNNALKVSNTKVIKITFNEPITAGSAYSSITVKNSGGAVKTMNASISGDVLTLTPVYNYLTGYKYTITIPANAIKNSAGNGLTTDYTSSFTITTTVPSVASADPVNGAVNVVNNKVIKITFNEPITPGSAYNQIKVINSAGAAKLMNPSTSGNVLTLTPVYNYLTGDKYTITIPANAIKDSAGNGLTTDYTSSFTTI